MTTGITPPAWLRNYARLESATLVLSYTGRYVGYNAGGVPEQWFLCKCNEKKPDHQVCLHAYKWLDLSKMPITDPIEWCLLPWKGA